MQKVKKNMKNLIKNKRSKNGYGKFSEKPKK